MKVNAVIGMLAAGGGMAAASAAAAGVTTINLGYPASSPLETTPIYLADATLPQYYFGALSALNASSTDSGLVSGFVDGRGTKADIGVVFADTTTSVPLTVAGFDSAISDGTLTFKNSSTSDGVVSVTSGPDAPNPGVDSYVYLLFADDSYDGLSEQGLYLGQAEIGADGSLTSISYAPAVPEPQAWVLLMAGVGMAGGALRGARRRRATAITA